jgi:MFS family permease
MFFLSWFHKYLTAGRGLETSEMAWLSSLPFLMGAAGNFLGGGLSDRLSATHGRKVGRVWLGASCLAIAGLLMLTTALVPGKLSAVLLLAAAFGVMDCMLPCAWAICLDLGQAHAGAVSGAMNSAGQAGGTVCIILFGYLTQWYGNYDLPLLVIGGMVLLAAVLFALLDPTRPLAGPPAEPALDKEQPACV